MPKEVNFNAFIKRELVKNAEIKNLLKKLKKLCSRDSLEAPVPKFYTGSFSRLYSELFHDRINTSEESTPFSSLMDQVKSNIYIWSMNHLTDDINGQSAVVSCTLPSLNMSIILTGDAQHSTFQRIFSEYRGRNFRSILNGLSPNHLVLLMLPHHGSRDNSSGSVLRFFQPDIFGISAGDGGQYDHPSYQLVQKLQDDYLSSQHNFLRKYEMEEKGVDFIAIQDNEIKFIETDENKVPFLCPNLYGCIKWDKDGISTNFDNTLEYKEKEYKILYDSHVWECDLMSFNRLKREKMTEVFSADESNRSIKLSLLNDQGDEIIVQKQESDELFVGVRVEDKIYFYRILEA